MASFDSIVNVDEWISDYYLTNDESKGESFAKATAKRIKDWREDDQSSATDTSPWARLTAARNQLQISLSRIDSNSPDTVINAAEIIEQSFGYPAPEQVTMRRSGEELQVHGVFAHQAMALRATPITGLEDLFEAKLAHPVIRAGKPTDTTAVKMMTELFLSEEPPAFIVLIAGSWVVLAERETWPLGRYLGIDVALAAERNDTKSKGELQQVCAALAWENIAQSADGTTWWLDTIEESREHAVKVSEDLRQAIKESIEIIGNDVLQRYRALGLDTSTVDGNELAKQSLRYLYRILFLLFAEASPELEILPTGVPEYDEGYGLSSLREQILIDPPTDRAAKGTYLFDSLELLFTLVNDGHDPRNEANHNFDAAAHEEGLVFRNLAADLFLQSATEYISRSKLSNSALHSVLQNLLLTRETTGKERGFVSYATLGVTQLGQVYEGLMSYTGFIADQELIEVAPHGNPSKGSWVVSPALAEDLPADSFVKESVSDGHSGTQLRNRRHKPGSFVYRQSSRDRERSASFYSPPVISEFVVSQALEVLEESGSISCADDILTLSICEPAMGSGAFAVETVNQLAELYLEKKQEELEEQIPPENLTAEKQRVKAFLALHQVYGVDLNRTAVELAEISLWLDTMTSELQAPWFGLHLRQGNSLIGASRSFIAAADLTTKSYLDAPWTHLSVEGIAEAIGSGHTDPRAKGKVHHFLAPSKGWGSAAESKDLASFAPESVKAMKNWRSSIRKGFNATQVEQLQKLAERVETLWSFALVRLQIAEDQIKRRITVWGQPSPENKGAVTRAQIEQELFENLNGPYQRLRLIMDAWNALWFWPTTQTDLLPSASEWLDMLQDALGRPNDILKHGKSHTLAFGYDLNWNELGYLEEMDFQASTQLPHDQLLEKHEWLQVAVQVAEDQAFFHWDLAFAFVMAQGGFDLQVGNPPWVRPRTNVDMLLSEHDPWFSLAHKPTQAEKNNRRAALLNSEATLDTVSRGVTESVSVSEVLGDSTRFPHLENQQPDLYRGFMERTWDNSAPHGVVALIHPESHFKEKKADSLRAGAYLRLRRHWEFVNELAVFDIHHLVSYGVHVYGERLESPEFLNAVSLYHPKTIVDSLSHDGSGPLPGFKDDSGNWDLRPHKDRITTVNDETLRLWHSILEEPSTPLLASRMVYTVNSESENVLRKLADAPRISELGLQFSAGWHESGDRKKGYFESKWQTPESWSDVILQGPHLGVATPMIKQPNPTMKHNQDWSDIDLEALPQDFIPATAYAPNKEKADYSSAYGTWSVGGQPSPVADHFRVAWRAMAATTGFRTLYPSLIPPEAQHVLTVFSVGPLQSEEHIGAIATSSSFLNDFVIRTSVGSNIRQGNYETLAFNPKFALRQSLVRRFLRMNCLTEAYAPLWEQITGEKWTPDTPIRNAKERWHAQNQIDALAALSLGVTADELCMIYRTQFPVMRKYDHEDLYDAHGRKVANEVFKLEKKLKPGEKLSEEQRTWTHPQSGVAYTYEYPFDILDREADLRAAYEQFTKEL